MSTTATISIVLTVYVVPCNLCEEKAFRGHVLEIHNEYSAKIDEDVSDLVLIQELQQRRCFFISSPAQGCSV